MKFFVHNSWDYKFLDEQTRTCRIVLNASNRNVVRMQIQKGNVWKDADEHEIYDLEDAFFYEFEDVREKYEEYGFNGAMSTPIWKNNTPVQK